MNRSGRVGASLALSPSGGEAGAHVRDRDGFLIGGDGLRALAAIAVLIFHAYVATVLAVGGSVAADPAHAFAPLGAVVIHLSIGLYVFFALSGYLVGGPFARAWVRGAPMPQWRPYLGRRLRRIVPAFWLVTGLLLLRFGTIGSDATEVVSLLLFNQNATQGGVQRLMPQGWTLDIELAFYLALPLVALCASRVHGPATPQGRLRVLLVVLALGALVSLTVRIGADPSELSGRNLITLLFAFVPGIVLAAGEDTWRRRLAGDRGRTVARVLLAGAVVTLAYVVVLDRRDGTWDREFAHLVFGGGLVGWVVVHQWATGAAPRGFTARPVRALGRWSYGIYLVHVGVGLELLRRRPDDLGDVATLLFITGGMLALSVLAAAASWRFVEEPFLRRRAPWAPRRGEPPTATTPEPHVHEAVG